MEITDLREASVKDSLHETAPSEFAKGGEGCVNSRHTSPSSRPRSSQAVCADLVGHTSAMPFALAWLSNPQAARAPPPATAPPSPPHAALRTIETFRRLLIDSKINAVGRIADTRRR